MDDLQNVVNLEAIAAAGLKIGVDPMGGAGVAFWAPIAERYGLNLEVVNPLVDPTFSFMTLDHDGKIRMDCSSPYAMASLVGLKDNFDIAFGNDTDYDRHGIVTRSVGLMNPNHYLATAIWYLFQNRPGLGQGGRHRQDPGLQLDDRPGGSAPGAQVVRGAGGLQVVRGWVAGWLVRLWR